MGCCAGILCFRVAISHHSAYCGHMKVHAVIVAGGKGIRAGGDTPKQRQLISGIPMYQWSLKAFEDHPGIESIVIVVPEADAKVYRDDAIESDRVSIAFGGRDRSGSVLNGLKALEADNNDIVLIHDAARPGLTSETIRDLVSALVQSDAAAPALPVPDALKRKSEFGLENEDRSNLFRVQTPQGFRYKMIFEALKSSNEAFIDDLAAIEALGGRVTLVEGTERLSKVTYPEDFERIETMISPTSTVPRIGTGFDVHAFGPGDTVTLCGVQIPHDFSLVGHSDADVAWHALTDAILGALALGDIGDHFPPSDPRWKGAPSGIFLKHAVELALKRGYEVTNCDLTLICEAPKIKPHRDEMRRKTADVIDIPIDLVSVKATTTERLGFTGRREGIAAQVACVLMPIPKR